MSEQPSKGSQLLASGKELFSKLPKDLNSLRQQTTPLLYRHEDTLKLQLYIRSFRGLNDQLSSLSKNSQLASKTLFEYSREDNNQGGDEDIVDIFDRAAFLQYKVSEVEEKAALKLEQARLLLKDIRNFENDLSIRRKNRTSLATKLSTLKEKDSTRNKNSEQIQSLQSELVQVDSEISTFESSFSSLKRQKLHESFSLQFAAQRELGDKLAIISSYGELLIQGMETDGIGQDYKGKQRTAQIKVELEQALVDWRPSPPPTLASSASSLHGSDTRSFGATHADQLSQLGSDEPTHSSSSVPLQHRSSSSHSRTPSGNHIHFVPPLETIPATPAGDSEPHRRPVPAPPPSHESPFANDPPSLPPRHNLQTSTSTSTTSSPSHNLNLSPTPQDLGSGFSPTLGSHAVPQPPVGVSPPQPTVAETGNPIIGSGGPSSGQLLPRRSKPSHAIDDVGEEGVSQVGDLSPPLPPPASTIPSSSSSSSMPGGLPFDEAGWDGVSTSSVVGHGPGVGVGNDNERLPGYGEGDAEAARANAEAERILAVERERKGSAAGPQ
ncbi:hypothetical protein JCM5350_000403 [Sporobolomyces pararoseus]